MDIVLFYKKRIEPFVAILILLTLIFAVAGLTKELKLKEEIKESCGYFQDEEVYCICDKSLAMEFDSPGNPYYIKPETTID